MKPQAFTRGLPPEPSDYGRKGDLSLGTDLLKWFRRAFADTYFEGKLPGNAFLWADLELEMAERWAAEREKTTSAIGRAVLVGSGLGGDVEAAGRIYRESRFGNKAEMRRARAMYAAAIKAQRSIAMAIQEAQYAAPIYARSNGKMSVSSLARIVARYFHRKPESVRKRIAQVFGLEQPRKKRRPTR